MSWEQVSLWVERVKVVLQALSFLGPIFIVPAFLWLRRIGTRLRQLYIATPKILHALAIFGNRERRAFDVDRRLVFYLRRLIVVLRVEAKRANYSLESQGVLEAIYQELGGLDKDIQELRQSGFRAREVQQQRELRDQQIKTRGASSIEIDQGELDATEVGPIERVLGE